MPDSFIEKFITLINAAPTVNFSELAVGISTLCILTLWPKWSQKIPAPLVALSAMGLMTYTLTHLFPQLQVATIGSRFQYVIQGVIGHGIPQLLPRLDWPWNFHDPSEIGFSLNFASLESIVPSAFAIATLGAIESLLSAVIADAMAQTRHDPNAELIALGIGNILCPFFGAVPATGALARTATNIRYGARSPISAVVHALFTLLVVLLLAPVLSYVPMASLAALLLLVAYNMSELRRFNYIVRVAPRSDVLVLLLCFSLTVLFDMVIGVSVGVVLAALLFMRRMAEVTNTQLVAGPTADPKLSQSIPAGVMVYQIHGPLFFGAADRAVSAIMDIHEQIRAVVYILNNVPVMDVSGLVALESAIKRIGTRKVVLVGLQAQPLELLTKSGFLQDNTQIQVVETLDQALTKLGRGARGQFGLPETNIATPDANKTLPGKQ